MPIFIFLIAVAVAFFFGVDGARQVLPSWSGQSSAVQAPVAAKAPASTQAGTSDEAAALAVQNLLGATSESPVCSLLKQYPRPLGEPLSFEKGEVSALCRPFVSKDRQGLDHCGDTSSDPYSHSSSKFTWASRNEMYKRGKVNIVTDPAYQSSLQALLSRAEEIRGQSIELCCAPEDQACRQSMAAVEVSVCQPAGDPNAPDSCVFGGYYQMAGAGYTAMYRAIYRQSSGPEAGESRKIAARNLGPLEVERMKAESTQDTASPFLPVSGKIVLSSYVSKTEGIRAIEPTLHHEFGHACSMIKMQRAAVTSGGPETSQKAARAVQWIDKVKDRCSSSLELPEAYYDFWESIGESRELASCLYRLTDANQKQKIDRTCEKLCPGHYLEESVGIAFSLLNGDLSGVGGAVYPNTCDHVRDGQHPMVSDVVDCLAQHSPRFRNRLRQAYRCAHDPKPNFSSRTARSNFGPGSRSTPLPQSEERPPPRRDTKVGAGHHDRPIARSLSTC